MSALARSVLLTMALVYGTASSPSFANRGLDSQCYFPSVKSSSWTGGLVSQTCPMPLNDLLWQPGILTQGPWTHQPLCAADTADPGPDSKVCVFTDATRGLHGLSLITTPEQAARAAAVSVCLPSAGKPAADKFEPVPYEVIDIPGKGKGAVAKRHIAAHESIIIDDPVLLVDNIHGKTISPSLTGEMRTRAVEQLARPEAVLGLSALDNSDDTIVNNIFRANSFELEFGEAKYGALYPGISVSSSHTQKLPQI